MEGRRENVSETRWGSGFCGGGGDGAGDGAGDGSGKSMMDVGLPGYFTPTGSTEVSGIW